MRSKPRICAAGPARRAGLLLVVPLGLALGGCSLVDQTTFGAKPRPPLPDQLTQALQAGSGVPLVVIRFDAAADAYDQAMRNAVDLALQRKPEAVFDLVTVVPARNTPDQQIALAEQGARSAAQVLAEMTDIGVPPDRIHLSVRSDPGPDQLELRIYVH